MSAYGRCNGCGSYGRWGHDCICNTPRLRAAIPTVEHVHARLSEHFPELSIRKSVSADGARTCFSLDLSHLPERGIHMGTPIARIFHQVEMLCGGMAGVQVELDNGCTGGPVFVLCRGTKLREVAQ